MALPVGMKKVNFMISNFFPSFSEKRYLVYEEIVGIKNEVNLLINNLLTHNVILEVGFVQWILKKFLMTTL